MKDNAGQKITALKAICFRYGVENTTRKLQLINEIAAELPQSAVDIISLHNCLLALIAYPNNEKIYRACQKLMNELVSHVAAFPVSKKNKLANIGIAGTEIISSFSYPLTKWLVKQFPEDVTIHSNKADAETIKIFFRQLLPRAEYENVSAKELNLVKRINLLKGENKISSLNWLINLLESARLPEGTKEFLFHELKIFTEWKLSHPALNKSRIGLRPEKIFFHRSLTRAFNFKSLLKKKITADQKITQAKKNNLISIAKTFLAYQCRETDPFTYASADEIKLFQLERGVSIALYGMNLQARFSIESYIGYLAFKNGIPVAYGGGWIFGERCQFGINIDPAFRGGESGYIFAQLLRLYHQHFKVQRFVIQPYQFGRNNSEGIKTGAFWFYYRFGFRPEDKLLNQIAADENEKRMKDKKYKTPVSVLKRFTSSGLFLNLVKNPIPLFDASQISKSVTSFINKKFEGNRNKAIKFCTPVTIRKLKLSDWRTWSREQKAFLKEWCLIAESHLQIENWTVPEQKKLIKSLKLKGTADERDFIIALQKNKKFWREISQTTGE